MSTNGVCITHHSAPSKALSTAQERKLLEHLENAFMSLMRAFKKRSVPSDNPDELQLPTLSSYLNAAQPLLSLILQIPPVDPSTSLRTTFLLRLTGDVLSSIPGYPPDRSVLPDLLEWLDDLDRAWTVVLLSQAWNPTSKEGTDVTQEVRSTPPSQTERTRLRSLLLVGAATLEEWLGQLQEVEGGADVEILLSRMGLQQGFEDLFSETLMQLGALGGAQSPLPQSAENGMSDPATCLES